MGLATGVARGDDLSSDLNELEADFILVAAVVGACLPGGFGGAADGPVDAAGIPGGLPAGRVGECAIVGATGRDQSDHHPTYPALRVRSGSRRPHGTAQRPI